MVQVNFNAQKAAEELPPSQFDLIPNGDYEFQIEAEEVKQTKSGDPMLTLTCVITGDKFNGRKVWKTILLDHSNPQAKEIGQRALTDLCLAVGKPHLGDTCELVGCRFLGKVGVEKGRDGYDDKNTIKAFKPLGAGAPTAGGPASSSPQTSSAPNIPWAKK